MANPLKLSSFRAAKQGLTAAMRDLEQAIDRTQTACDTYTEMREAMISSFDEQLTPFDRRLLRAARITTEVKP